MHTNFYRIQTMFDRMSKALKVPGLVGISRIWGHSEPHTRGQTTLEVAENWCPVRFLAQSSSWSLRRFPDSTHVTIQKHLLLLVFHLKFLN